jgi:hypothetical protein
MGPKQDLPDRPVIFRIHKSGKVGGGEGKRKYSARHAAHMKRSETRNICKFCVLLHKGTCFEKYQ